jgi:hypothetical protein
VSAAAEPDFVDFLGAVRFFFGEDFFSDFNNDDGIADKTFSLSASNEYGDGDAGMMASQIIASVSGTFESFLSDEEYVA